jgi:predicted Zn-dependent protease
MRHPGAVPARRSVLLALLALLAPAALPAHVRAQGTAGSQAADPTAALFARLAAAPTRAEAVTLEQQIELAQEKPLSPTTRVLVEGGNAALVAGNGHKAVQDLDSAIDLQPELGLLWRERAVMRLHTGDVAGAIADLGQAIDRDQRDFQSWSILSEITESKGDNDAAYAAWQKVLTLDPQAADAQKRLDTLKRKALGAPA